jgi:hypothetical protein
MRLVQLVSSFTPSASEHMLNVDEVIARENADQGEGTQAAERISTGAGPQSIVHTRRSIGQPPLKTEVPRVKRQTYRWRNDTYRERG